jgi:uncharacterized protein (TIGR02453 family)
MFEGFSKETVRFLAGLSRNNDKSWFEDHRDDYEAHFVTPAKAFVEAIGPRLERIESSIQAVPKVNGSIMRINRDIRFSKDKAPYKDHLDLWFWSGTKKGWDASGFFFRLTPARLMLGAGMHGFVPPVLARYRKAVVDDRRGGALAKVVAKLRDAGFDVGGQTYKKPPRGIDEGHPRASLLKHSALYVGSEGKHPKELGSARLIDYVAKRYAAMAPLHEWLRSMA